MYVAIECGHYVCIYIVCNTRHCSISLPPSLILSVLLTQLYYVCTYVCVVTLGKDLSRVSMPVSLNEPLSALQRLCEEVQYSELLDQAALLDNPYDRMVRHLLVYSGASNEESL